MMQHNRDAAMGFRGNIINMRFAQHFYTLCVCTQRDKCNQVNRGPWHSHDECRDIRIVGCCIVNELELIKYRQLRWRKLVMVLGQACFAPRVIAFELKRETQLDIFGYRTFIDKY